MRCAHFFLLLGSLAIGLLTSGTGLANAAGGDGTLNQELDRALHKYGWRPEAIVYLTSHTHLIDASGGVSSPCPSAVACSMRDGNVYVNQLPGDPSAIDYVLNHEAIHAMEFARGSAESSVGPTLADVVALSNDADYPLAASAARRVLELTGRDDHAVITGQDWFHIEHYVLEDVGWDVANLPAWYRDAYFPYLTPGPAARKAVTLAPAPPPKDTDLRTQRVLDAIVKMCGPVLPGARVSAPSVACDHRPLWSAVPYAPLTGGAAPPLDPPEQSG